MVYIWNSISLKYWTDWYIQKILKDKALSYTMVANCLRKWIYLRKVKLQVDDSCIMILVKLWSLHVSWLYSWLFYTLSMGFLKELVWLNKYILNLCTAGCCFFCGGREKKQIVLIEMKPEILLEIYCYLLILTYPNLGSTVISPTYPHKLHASSPPFTPLKLHSEWLMPGVALGPCIVWKVS